MAEYPNKNQFDHLQGERYVPEFEAQREKVQGVLNTLISIQDKQLEQCFKNLEERRKFLHENKGTLIVLPPDAVFVTAKS